MNRQNLVKFSSQAAPEVIDALKQISEAEGRQFQSILDEALRDYIDRRQTTRPRQHVLAALGSSIAEFDQLYRDLAKLLMSRSRDYLTLADIIGIYSVLMKRYGGASSKGIKEHSKLPS